MAKDHVSFFQQKYYHSPREPLEDVQGAPTPHLPLPSDADDLEKIGFASMAKLRVIRNMGFGKFRQLNLENVLLQERRHKEHMDQERRSNSTFVPRSAPPRSA